MHGSKQKKACPHCKAQINAPNFNRHVSVCDGRGTQAMKDAALKLEIATRQPVCEICVKKFKSVQGLIGHMKRSHDDKQKQSVYGRLGNGKLRQMVAAGEITLGTPHTEAMKQHLSKIACDRIAKHSKYSQNTEYKPGIILESSYEVRTAEILDSLGVEWIKVRKGYIWHDGDKIRQYIPDFYLPAHDLFLDPKNDYLITKDKVKIDSAMLLNSIKVVVLSDSEINEEFIKNMLL